MANNRGGWIRADELQRLLADDPAYLALEKEQTERREQLEAALAEDEKSLVDDLRYIGFRVGSVWDFVNSNEDYSVAVPVLLKHLALNHHPTTIEGIARALIIPSADAIVARALIEAFQRFVPNDKAGKAAKWALGYAIAMIAGPEFTDDIRALLLAKGETHAKTGLINAHCIRKPNKSRYEAILNILLLDECQEMVLSAIESVAKYKCHGCIAKLDELSRHNDREIAKRAQWALKKLSKVTPKRETNE